MLDKIKKLRDDHILAWHGIVFYPYQKTISDNILDALLQNLRLTSSSSEDDIKKLKTVELPTEISRQSGKTTAIVLTVEFIMIFFKEKFNKRINIGLFAPQIEQAKTDFDRLKEALNRSQTLFDAIDSAEAQEYKEQNNSKTIVLQNGSSCYIFPITPTSRPESKTFDLMIFEEAQDLQDKIVKEQVWPMGSTTNAPRIYVGTAGTRLCYFRTLGLTGGIKLYFEEIVKQRRQVYELTHDAKHLIYEQFVRGEIERHGLESDEIQRPYFGKWLIGTGNFCTEEALEKLRTDRGITYHFTKNDCFAGIDTAKHPDSTVCTIVRDTGEIMEKELKDGTKQLYRKKELLNWCELRGENYQNQFEILKDFLSNYNIVAVAIDSTGQGDFMPDMFENNTEWADENSGLYRVKFSGSSKDIMYKNLKVVIEELLTTLPILSTNMGEKFKQQMLDLQQEYKGYLLSVSHPDDPKAHDDYPDSWALAEWAFAKWYATSNAGIAVISSSKERKVEKDETGKVTDHWPGYND